MAIRYQRLGFIALNVTDLDKSEDFYGRLVGLEVTGRGPDDCRFLRCSDRHHDVVLYKSETPGLKRIGFEMESAGALEELRETLTRHGLPVVQVSDKECVAHKIRNCIRTVEPHTGACFDFYETMAEYGGRPFRPTVAKIQRLGHVVLKTDEYRKAIEFFTKVLNFQVSDEVDGAVIFMRCFPNPFHHSFALGQADRKSFHHVNFMVTEVDDIGRAIWRFQKENVVVVNGPGRHPPSGSMFYYFLDPDNLTVEYSFGMEEFPEREARKPRLLEAVRDSIDFWGAPVDSRKSAFGSIETNRSVIEADKN